MRAWLIAFVLVLLACAGDGRSSALALEGRLIAPCCWTQTLDVHESELAKSLREEIEERLARGERADVIEEDLVDRFGERMRAVPKGKDPRSAIPLVTAIAMLAVAAVLVVVLRRWTTKRATTTSPPPPAHARDAYDERLDAELADLDDAR